MIEFINNEITQ